jgi:phenylalanine-4-hydroxylase
LSGIFDEVVTDENNSPIYLRTSGKTALAFRNKELEGHGVDYHKDGFGSPIGKWKETSTSPESLSDDELRKLRIVEGKKVRIEFTSGIVVNGKVEKIFRRDGRLQLVTFSSCSAKYGDRVLFDPDWGSYDMAVGERITSVFNGAADKDAYNQVALVPKERTIKVPSDAKRKRLENLYAQVRKIRMSKTGYDRLGEIWETQQAEHPDDWLLSMEIFELLDTTGHQPELKARIEKFLNERKAKTKDLSTLISWGFRLVEYHKKPEYQAALHASPK